MLAAKIIIVLTGISLCVFYGFFVVAALVNFPESWLGVFYCFTGITSGVLCFVYIFKKNNLFFLIIVPAVIFMLITLKSLIGPQ